MSSIANIVQDRKITEVLHFTTNLGLAGILGSQQVLSRKRLPEEKYLEHVYKPNAKFRRDKAHLDYVNLSISRLNTQFFGSSQWWHRDEAVWWCALAFDPEILSHDGVLFATTNNTYSGCLRAPGPAGLEALFATRILQYEDRYVARPSDLPPNRTTCLQAEALYPKSISCDYLRPIYVRTDHHSDVAATNRELLLPERSVPVVVDPDVFKP